jgi:hypothetical protein
MKTGFEKAKGTVWQCGRLLLAALHLLITSCTPPLLG